MKNDIKFSQGFTLIELMVSLVAGLIVIGAVGAFMMSSFRSNTDYVAATRLTQELRNSIDFISRDLRRAGYDENALDYLALPDSATKRTSDFSPLLINGSCVIYAYDRTPGEPGLVNRFNGEIRGIRRVVNADGVGVIEFAESAVGLTPACNGAQATYTTYPATCSTGGWCALSDPRVINISELTIDTTGYVNVNGTTAINPLQIRDVVVRVRGNLVGDTTVSRSVESSIRIRADCLKSNPVSTPVDATPDCNQAPVQTGTN